MEFRYLWVKGDRYELGGPFRKYCKAHWLEPCNCLRSFHVRDPVMLNQKVNHPCLPWLYLDHPSGLKVFSSASQSLWLWAFICTTRFISSISCPMKYLPSLSFFSPSLPFSQNLLVFHQYSNNLVIVFDFLSILFPTKSWCQQPYHSSLDCPSHTFLITSTYSIHVLDLPFTQLLINVHSLIWNVFIN